MPNSAFTELLHRVLKNFPTQKALAEALGIDLGHLNKLLNGHGRPFNIVNCLRLALVADLSPSDVLRAAGKAEIAALLEEAYGAYRKSDLTAAQRRVLRLWDGLAEQVRPDLERHIANLSRRNS